VAAILLRPERGVAQERSVRSTSRNERTARQRRAQCLMQPVRKEDYENICH
jgi:hypothetical protein